jgi:hypothetical protein
MIMSEETLRILVGAIALLVIVTRLYGVINPKRMKGLAAKASRLGPGWIRAIYLVTGLLGVWILYSALIIIFGKVAVFLVISLMLGLLFLLAGVFVIHPEWFPQVMKGMVAERGELFIRFICLLGVLGGIFILLTAIFENWGG